MFPLLLKVIVNLVTGFAGMTYLNQTDFYNLKDTWHTNAVKALNAFQQHVHGEHAFGSLDRFPSDQFQRISLAGAQKDLAFLGADALMGLFGR